MKDNFSTKSDDYSKYRPTYPVEMFEFINSLVAEKANVWDCGTGNGQVAGVLANSFKHVFATDISQPQLDNAVKKDNIEYSLQRAEKTNFKNNFFDMIVVAQAIHWFEFTKFYAEVNRTAKDNSYLVVIGYGLHSINPTIDKIILDFYGNIVGPFWDKERKYLDENYETIPFPFNEIESPSFKNSFDWTIDHFIGYLNTWSAVKHYAKEKGHNPVDLIEKEIKSKWGKTATHSVNFPLLLRIGKIEKTF